MEIKADLAEVLTENQNQMLKLIAPFDSEEKQPWKEFEIWVWRGKHLPRRVYVNLFWDRGNKI